MHQPLPNQDYSPICYLVMAFREFIDGKGPLLYWVEVILIATPTSLAFEIHNLIPGGLVAQLQ